MWFLACNISVFAAKNKGYIFPVPDYSKISQYYSSSHNAIDIAANLGSNVYATKAGTIIKNIPVVIISVVKTVYVKTEECVIQTTDIRQQAEVEDIVMTASVTDILSSTMTEHGQNMHI